MAIARLDRVLTPPGVAITVRLFDEASGLVLIAVGAPGHGSADAAADGSLTYTPEAGFKGLDELAYSFQDADGAVADGVLQVVVDNAPSAVDDEAAVTDGQVVDIAVLANDQDVDGDALRIVGLGQPDHGTVGLDAAQTGVRYRPQAGFVGIDRFVYTIADVYGAIASAAVTVLVDGVNRAPEVQGVAMTTTPGAPIVVPILATAVDPDGDALSLVGLGLPDHGRLAVNPDRSVTYTPADGYLGPDRFTYTLSDGRGGSADGEVTVDVTRRNTAPIAAADSATTAAATPVTLAPLANDVDAEGDTLSLVGLSLPEHGILAVNADQSITYTPAGGFAGTDRFGYTVRDGDGLSAAAEASIVVTAPAVTPAFANGYLFRRRIVVPAQADAAAADGDFVLFVDERDARLADTAHGGRVRSAQGHDIRFTREDGTALDHELDRYDPVAGELTAWVRLPDWDAAAQTRLFLYYGKPGVTVNEAAPQATWQDCLACIDPVTGADLSGNGHALAATAVAPARLVGRAGPLDGSAAVLSGAVPSWLDGRAAFTLMLWSESEVAGSDRGLLAIGPFSGQDAAAGLVLRHDAAGTAGEAQAWSAKARFADIVDARSRGTARSAGDAAQLVALRWSSGEALELFLDGVGQPFGDQRPAGPTALATGELRLGSGATAAGGRWQGLIGRLIVYGRALAPGFLRAAWSNQRLPHGFYGIGAEDTADDTNRSPVAVPVTASTNAGSFVDLDVLAAAVEVDAADRPAVIAFGQPAHGSVGVVAGRLRYTPLLGFVGEDSIAFTLSDGRKTSAAVARVAVRQSDGQGLPGAWGVGPRSSLPFWSGGAQSGIVDLEALRRRPNDVITVFGPRASFEDVQGGSAGTTLDGWFGGYFAEYYNSQSRLALSYGYFPSAEGLIHRAAYQAAASGAYDTLWRAWSAKLKRLRQRNPAMQVPVIRPGWEMNVTGSYPWFVDDTPPATYIAVWQRLVSIIRADHPDAPICWCPLKGNRLPNPVAAYWPGSSHVDLVGVDYYARSMSPAPTSAAAFAAYADSGTDDDPRGVAKWLAFARKRGKLLCVPEWGLVLPSGGKDGAHGDAPEYIQGMWNFFNANKANIAFEAYHNLSDNVLAAGEAAQSRQRYKTLWGNGR